MISLTSCKSTILTPATMKTVPPMKKGRLRLCLEIFVSREVRTHTGQPIMLSYHAISSYWGVKSYFSYSLALKQVQNWNINRKCQFTGYILLLVAEIVFLYEFFRKQKMGIGIAMKKVRDTGFSWKKAGRRNQEPCPHFQTLLFPYLFSKEDPLTPISICRNTFLKGQIIGKSKKTMIYTFISAEFFFSGRKIEIPDK